MKYIKNDIVKRFSKESKIKQEDAFNIINHLFRTLRKLFIDMEPGDVIEIRGFGNFEMIKVEGHIGHNPKTMEPVVVPARRRLKFSPSKTLKKIFKKL